MSQEQILIFLLLGTIIVAWYATNRLRNKTLCRVRRKNNTLIEGFVTTKADVVIVDGREFEILPDRVVWQWFTRGVHQFFPMFVPTLDYSWWSRFPHDPKTFEAKVVSPRVVKMIDNERRYGSFAKGVGAQVGKKQTGLGQLLPYMALLLIGIVAFWFNSQMATMSQHIAVLENTLKSIVR